MLRGGCLRGGIRSEIVGPAGTALFCHGSMGRKFHGSAFRARLSVPSSSFRCVRGEERVTSYLSSADTVKRFCRICGSSIVNPWGPEPDNDGLAMGSLDDDPGIRQGCRMFVGFKAPWYEITDALPQYRESPEP